MSIRKLLAYAAIYILWGGSFLAIREIVGTTPPFFAAGFRFLLAGLILILYSYLRGGVVYARGSLLGASALGFIMFTCMYAALFWAEIQVPSGIAAVISAMIPVWIFIGELTILRTQRTNALTAAGILLGFAGVLILTWHSPASGTHGSPLAMMVLVAGTLCWSGGTLLLLLSAAAGEWRHMPPLAVFLQARIILSMAYLVFAASVLTFTAYVW